MSLAKNSCLALLAFGLLQSCLAQQAGFRDLTASWRAPDDHVPSPSSPPCPRVNSTISDGDIVDPVGSPGSRNSASLRLTVKNLAPPQLRLGDDFVATLRLENIGSAPVLIPWQSDGEKVTRISQDGTEEKYEVADISFRLATGKKRTAMPLQSEGALFANPDDPASYIPLAPGRWLELRLKGNVTCGLEQCPSSVVADEHAVLTAWWYQRVLSHKVKDCSEDHGSHKVREVDSAPFPVVLHPAPLPSGNETTTSDQRDLATGMLPAGGRYSRPEPTESHRALGKLLDNLRPEGAPGRARPPISYIRRETDLHEEVGFVPRFAFVHHAAASPVAVARPA